MKRPVLISAILALATTQAFAELPYRGGLLTQAEGEPDSSHYVECTVYPDKVVTERRIRGEHTRTVQAIVLQEAALKQLIRRAGKDPVVHAVHIVEQIPHRHAVGWNGAGDKVVLYFDGSDMQWREGEATRTLFQMLQGTCGIWNVTLP